MNKQEFARLAMVIKTAYPKDNLIPTKEAMSIWYQMLSDIPYNIAEVALQKWISTSKWAPTIADIREYSSGVSTGTELTWGEAWHEVTTAISKYGYMNEDKAMQSLSPLARKTAQTIGYQILCTSENIAVERANFRKCFETFAQREKEDAQLPTALIETIHTLQLGEFKDATMLPNSSGNSTEDKKELPAHGAEQDNEEVVSDPLRRIQEIRERLSANFADGRAC